jgi:hypothetical protein
MAVKRGVDLNFAALRPIFKQAVEATSILSHQTDGLWAEDRHFLESRSRPRKAQAAGPQRRVTPAAERPTPGTSVPPLRQ